MMSLPSTTSTPPSTSTSTSRAFSGDGGDKKRSDVSNTEDDPFGVDFEDGTEHGGLGPAMPPRFKRDELTGKFTGEKEMDISDRDRKFLKMDPIEEQEQLLDRVMKEFKISGLNDAAGDGKLSKLANRIRDDNIGVNTLGRSVESQSFQGKLDDGDEAHSDRTGLSKPLSPSEFKVFQKHMKDEYGAQIDESDIPVEPSNDDEDTVFASYADEDYLNRKWMSSSAVRFMDDTKDDDPFSDLLPSDLTPQPLVNRRKAKPIPKELLHHNNLALLRRYITPTGQIMNRVQSRLGAKDQRRIAKLIKRARSLGLIPNAGQFVVEARGDIHEDDIHAEKDWEEELRLRGLVVHDTKEQNGP